MQLIDLLHSSFRQFRTRRLESLLIVVAVALGVGVVTAVAAFLDLDRQAQARFNASLEAREITIARTEDDPDIFREAPAKRVGSIDAAPVSFAEEDLERARSVAPTVHHAYLIETKLLSKEAGFIGSVRVAAVTPEYLSAMHFELRSGSLFSESDFAEQRNVMLLFPETVSLLELEGDPVGQSVVFTGTPGQPEYRIIGLLADLGPNATTVRSDAFIPYAPTNMLTTLNFAVDDPALLPEARAELAAFADATWGLDQVSVRASSDYRVFSARQRVTSVIIAAFASIGLVVAALNIMNLMLARVFKEQRAVGIRWALGATRSTLRNQFLCNSLLLGGLGGLLGIPAGYGLLAAYNRYLNTDQTLNLALPPTAILTGVSLATGVSLLFGLYPAIMAARVRVVEVLRDM